MSWVMFLLFGIGAPKPVRPIHREPAVIVLIKVPPRK